MNLTIILLALIKIVHLLLYVDDMLLIKLNMKMVNKIKRYLSKENDMNDLGYARGILGTEIDRDRSNFCLFVYQTPYMLKILKKFSMLIVNLLLCLLKIILYCLNTNCLQMKKKKVFRVKCLTLMFLVLLCTS